MEKTTNIRVIRELVVVVSWITSRSKTTSGNELTRERWLNCSVPRQLGPIMALL